MDLNRRISDNQAAILEMIAVDQNRKLAAALACWHPYFQQLELNKLQQSAPPEEQK